MEKKAFGSTMKSPMAKRQYGKKVFDSTVKSPMVEIQYEKMS